MACSSALAWVIEIPGMADGMYRMAPSSRGGMNSEPKCRNTGMVMAITATAEDTTTHFQLSVHRTIGS